MSFNRKFVLVIVGLFFSAAVSAAPVVWTIDSLVFDDGGTASGTFTYDADANAFSNIDIETTAGTAFGGAPYTSVVDYAANSSTYLVVMVAPLEGLPGLELSFAAALTNAGGTIAIAGNGESICGQGCEYPVSELRQISAGQISAVPVPAAAWLFASGLAGLGWVRRKQQA